ncbi:unnamed protein product, partial [Onchocerca flexuosa]|uniref:Evolutionarily conserved signaling intermediate in Toll pathway, mitochondrial n=1 Tax=Onchocerca flexuosa TaxID=387005 RepID=A0A183I5T5_9BILA
YLLKCLHQIQCSFVSDNFCKKQVHARGHVEFINTALKYMKEYGLQKDLDIYKSLLNVFPKGPMIPQNVFQQRILYYPQQQICCVKLLDEMEWFGVQPDKEIHDLVVNAFGEWNYATKKINDRELDESDRWLLSSQSHLQKKLLQNLEKNTTLYVDGPNKVYLMDHCIEYVGLFSDPKSQYYEKHEEDDLDEDFENWKSEWDEGYERRPKHNIHEQQHETILALSIFGKVTCRFDFPSSFLQSEKRGDS